MNATPAAYKKGKKEFYGRDFLVTPDVLIPRPETEQLIDLTLSLAGKAILPGLKPPQRELPEKPRILDLGTGSGCIGITLGLELPEASIALADISEPALKIAKKNAKNLGAKNLTFLRSNLLDFTQFTEVEKISSAVTISEKIPKVFDLIVANLPYVDKDWDWLDQPSLSFEPDLALYAKNEGLDLIFQLLAQLNSPEYPKTKFLILEADPCQHQKILNRATKLGFAVRTISGFALLLEQSRQASPHVTTI